MPPKTLGVKLKAPSNVTFRINIAKYTNNKYIRTIIIILITIITIIMTNHKISYKNTTKANEKNKQTNSQSDDIHRRYTILKHVFQNKLHLLKA